MRTRTHDSSTTARVSRRDVLKQTVVLGAGLASGVGFFARRDAAAAELPRLAEDNPQAVALGYRHDATAVDAAKYPTADPDAKICGNCQLFRAEDGSQWGACPLFAGRAVNTHGWCTAWAKRVG